jgi:hypothetical protein
MMDAIVQLVRNGLCCIKDLDLLKNSTSLYDASAVGMYYDFPEPLNKTTPLEALISICQLYAFFSVTIEGYKLLSSSLGKLRRVERIIETRHPVKTDADRLVNASLVKEGMAALRGLFVGQNVLFIGVSFVWLFGNSWHVTETQWIGGLQGLIHALTVMEVCLVPLLYYMIKDARDQLLKAKRLEELAAGNGPKKASLTMIELVHGYKPFWEEGVSPLATVDSSKEEKQVEGELAKVKDLLGKKMDPDMAKDLLATARVTRLEGYREIFYFFLNLVAFYGYLLSVLAYYFDDEKANPSYMRHLLFGFGPADADWHGNFAGDVMWTVEPLIILGSPLLLRKPKKKVKAD